MFKMMKKDEGFTLVELMIVVLIIGILVAIAIPIFNNASDQAKKKACEANIRTINGAINQMAATEGVELNTITTVESLVTGKYLKEAPICPITEAGYTIESGSVVEKAHGHADAGADADADADGDGDGE